MLIFPDIILKQCLSGYVLHNSLLHLLLKIGDFLNTDISQGSVATRLGCGGIFIYHFVTNFQLSLTVKEFWKLVNIWWSYGQEFGVLFFDSRCISVCMYMLDLLAAGPHFTRPAFCAAAAAVDRYLLPAPDLSSKPAGRRCCCRLTGQTDGRTDTWPFCDVYSILCAPRNNAGHVAGIVNFHEFQGNFGICKVSGHLLHLCRIIWTVS